LWNSEQRIAYSQKRPAQSAGFFVFFNIKIPIRVYQTSVVDKSKNPDFAMDASLLIKIVALTSPQEKRC